MSEIICNRENCKMRKGPFCGMPYVHMTPYGQCAVWFAKNGQPYQQPDESILFREMEKSIKNTSTINNNENAT